MWSTIFTAASTVLGSRMAEGNQPTAAMTAADVKSAINFTPYKMQTSAPEQAGEVGQVGGAVQYNQLRFDNLHLYKRELLPEMILLSFVVF